MKGKTGRNDLCFCGSGRKYKVCCLANQSVSVSDFAWHKLRQCEGTVMDQHLIPYVMEKLPPVVIETALEDLIPENLPEAIDEELLFTNFFLPWLMFNWIPDDDFGIDDFSPNEPIALQYSRKNKFRLDHQQKQFIESICQTHYSFYVIVEVIPEEALIIKDIILGNEFKIKERQGTRSIKRGDIVFSRVLSLDEQSICVGMAPYLVPARCHHDLLKFRDWLIEENDGQALTAALLRDEFEMELMEYFFSVITALFNQPFPKLHNTDDDPIQFCKSYFKLELSLEETLNKLLPLSLSDDANEFLSEAQYDHSGALSRIKFPWLKKGNKRLKAWENTLMGDITLHEDTLILETNSENRSKKGQTLLKKYLKEKIHFQSTLIESVEQKMKNSPSNGTEKQEVELQNNPEIQERLKEMAQQHWLHWFDEPIPLLDHKTPREAAKTKKGREQLEALLLEYERNNLDQSNNAFKADIALIRSELALH